MKRVLILSIILNIVCLPLAAIYMVRKVQFYQSIQPKDTSAKDDNLFWKIRNSEFKTLDVDSNSIVFFGDSHTQNFEVAEAFKSLNVKNRGIILDGTATALERLDYIVSKQPKKIFIQIGINDLLSGVTPKVVSDDIEKMIEKTKYISPRTSIYIQSVFPTNWNKFKDQKPVLNDVIELNRLLQSVSDKYNCAYIDLFSLLVKGSGLNPEYESGDSLHLNGKGYVLWRDYITRFVAN